MWVWEISTGNMYRNGSKVSTGYSGAEPDGKNNPAMQDVKDVGPIPEGLYTIGKPFDSPKHGPFALPLEPNFDNKMYGRSEFLIHGDSIEHPGMASEGCIIIDRPTRQTIFNSNDTLLEVVAYNG